MKGIRGESTISCMDLKAAMQSSVLTSYAQLMEEKNQLCLLVESYDLQFQGLKVERDALEARCQNLQVELQVSEGKNAETYGQLVLVFENANQLQQVYAAQTVELEEKKREIAALKNRTSRLGVLVFKQYF